MISFVVPAHNEEVTLPQSLSAIFASAQTLDEPFEVIVVDDASTDRTAQVADEFRARVQKVELRKISAVRNAGARVAKGDILIFVDADTIVTDGTIRAALSALQDGAVGGGARVKLERGAPWWGHLSMWMLAPLWFRMRWAAGCFVFAQRESFERVGGFDENHYFGEEMYISKALKRDGRFVIVREPVITSARKFRTYSIVEMLTALGGILLAGPKVTRGRDHAQWWYDARREKV